MNNIELRQWQQLDYHDPEFVLKRLREIELNHQDYDIDPKIRNLRTNRLKPEREGRQAALFCYGMGVLIKRTIWFSPFEADDYDFVALWKDGDRNHFSPIQLKELVPEQTNINADINKLISNLSQYDSPSLTVAIYLNRNVRVEFEKINCEGLNISELWLFGSNNPEQTRWLLYGNLLKNPGSSEFTYPTP